MQCVKQEVTFQQYYHKNFTFPERTGKETFMFGNSDAISHFQRSYNYDYIGGLSENLDPVVSNENMWQKKQKPKPYNYKYSPRRGENRFNSPFRKYQAFTNNQRMPDSFYNANCNDNQRWISEANQSGAPNDDFGLGNKKNMKYKAKSNKNNFKQDDTNVVWTLPQDKKFQ